MKNIFNQNLLLLTLCLFMVSLPAVAQSPIDLVLDEVRKNNPTLKSSIQVHEQKKLIYKTGLSSGGPQFEYEYFRENRDGNGYQHDFLAKQELEFPGVYSKRKNLMNLRTNQSAELIIMTEKEIMHETRLICLEIIHLKKIARIYNASKTGAEKILSAAEKRLNNGDGNILEFNKAKLQYMEAEKQLTQNITAIKQNQLRLTMLNGGVPITFSGDEYPETPALPPFEKLEAEIESADPQLKILESEKAIAHKNVELAKTENLPVIALGYRYQSLPGQEFNGIHTGFTIPLWENKNKVKQSRAGAIVAELKLKEHLNEHYSTIKQLHEEYLDLLPLIANYSKSMSEIQTPVLLEKAFDKGHIGITEYYQELNYFQKVNLEFLETENRFHRVVAELNRYRNSY